MAVHAPYFWKKAPFIKLLLSMMSGIMLQWHWRIDVRVWWLLIPASFLVLSVFFLIPFFDRYKFLFISGIAVSCIFFSFGALLTWHKDIRNDKNWLGNFYKDKDAIVVTLDEPLVEKTRSFKANATANYLLQSDRSIPVNGKVIVYFIKDLPTGQAGTSLPKMGYGSQIIFKKSLQEIKNSGNPGGFDYKQYALFQGITHQVYLKHDEFDVLKKKNEKWLDKFLYPIREKVIHILRKYIHGQKEQGLAEAVLIGYKDDLDRDLVQSYTNTGVVHIIVIAGLHLGMVYWVLVLFTRWLKKRKKIKWLAPLIIIAGLWLFSLVTGAHAPVMRSAVMLTCVVLAESIGRKTSVYNTLALSAFILLCYNPFWLWDAGFQLSYAAVTSIVTFVRPIYNWFYIKNKALDFLWKLNAVSIAAQLFTLPFSIYHFHQFPNYFLLTNFIAVPLALVILLGEIFLCFISFIKPLAVIAGSVLSGLIWLMNTYIERIESLPGSVWDGLYITIPQTILLMAFVAGISFWLMEKHKTGLQAGLVALSGFMVLRSISFLQANRQQKIIVYNIPQRRAIDLIDGRNYFFVGDSDLEADDFARNFYLKPSRTLFRITPAGPSGDIKQKTNYFQFAKKKIVLIDSSISFQPIENKQTIDLLVISKDPKLYMTKLASALNIKQVIFDGSVPPWKKDKWKKDCDSLHIPCYDVTVKGAFVMNLR